MTKSSLTDKSAVSVSRSELKIPGQVLLHRMEGKRITEV